MTMKCRDRRAGTGSARMCRRWAAALLSLALGTPALAFGPTYTTYYSSTLCTPSGSVDSSELSIGCGANYVSASGSFDGGHASAALAAGLNRFSGAENIHTSFVSGVVAEYNWNDQLSIVSATLPIGTPVRLTIGTQTSMRYDVSAREGGDEDGVFAQAHFKIASPSYFGNDLARTRFRSTAGWQYADETSGSWGGYGSEGTTGITRGGILVHVGELVTVDLIFRASAGIADAAWWQTDTPYSANLHGVDAYFAIGVEPLEGVAALARSSFSAQATPLVDYVAASGVRFPASLPVPEPSTFAMLIAGLLVLGIAARRRTRRSG